METVGSLKGTSHVFKDGPHFFDNNFNLENSIVDGPQTREIKDEVMIDK